MIRHWLFAFSIVFLLAPKLAVHADVVMGNEFHHKNEDKTEAVSERWYGKAFIINSPLGYVVPKTEPGSEYGVPSGGGYRSGWGYEDIDDPKYSVFVFKNGEIVVIQATYCQDGEYWGIMMPSHMYQPPGWVLMDDLLMFYDQQDFEEENRGNFYTYTGSFDAVLSAKMLVEWQWPGSDREKRTYDDEETIVNCTDVLYAYKDGEGREWGKTCYTEGWVCLSDPDNKGIEAFYPAPDPVKWSHDGTYDWHSAVWNPAEPTDLPRPASDMWIILMRMLIMTVAVVAATVLTIMAFNEN
ncbi:MAG: hypothetical protein FWG42_11420 [Clostridiales bacterium]|nr:hypothetical protein [Clostridiales bacterium]